MALLQARFGIQKKLLEDKNHKFSRFQTLFTGTAPFTIFVIANLLFFLGIFFALVDYGLEKFYTFEQTNFGECITRLDGITIAMICVYVILFGTFAITLSVTKVKENLGIRLELVFYAITGVIVVFSFIGVGRVEDDGKLGNLYNHN